MIQEILNLSPYPLMDSKQNHYDGIIIKDNPICNLCNTRNCIEAKFKKNFIIEKCYKNLLYFKITINEKAYIVYGLANNYSELSKNQKKNYPARNYFDKLYAVKRWTNKVSDIIDNKLNLIVKEEKNNSLFIHDVKKTYSSILRKIEKYISAQNATLDFEMALKKSDHNIIGIYKSINLLKHQFSIIDYVANPESSSFGKSRKTSIYKTTDKLVRIFRGITEKKISILGTSHNVLYLYDSFVTLLFILIDNAIKYSFDEQDIDIVISDIDSYGVEVKISTFSPHINDESKLLIFNKYYRDGTREGIEGQGVGLFIAKTIATYLSTKIYVKSHLNNIKINDCESAVVEFTVLFKNVDN